MSNEPVGSSTTTLDYLYYKYPWLKLYIENKNDTLFCVMTYLEECLENCSSTGTRQKLERMIFICKKGLE